MLASVCDQGPAVWVCGLGTNSVFVLVSSWGVLGNGGQGAAWGSPQCVGREKGRGGVAGRGERAGS